MFRNRFTWSQPWRENFEARAIAGWVLFIPIALMVAKQTSLPTAPYYLMVLFALVMICSRVGASYQLWKRMRKLRGVKLWKMKYNDYWKKITKVKNKNQFFLGEGFEWKVEHAQRAMDAMALDIDTYAKKHSDPKKAGKPWIHGMNDQKDKEILWDFEHTTLHSGIVGTTGAGKTTFLNLISSQIICRGDALIIIDPKGDQGLADNAKKAVEAWNTAHPDEEERPFYYFHRSFPEKSVSLDPLASFTNAGDLATRIAGLMSSSAATGDPFQGFSQMQLTNICAAMLYINKKPSLVDIRRYFEGGVEKLLSSAIEAYAIANLGANWFEPIAQKWSESSTQKKKAFTLMNFYWEHMADDFQDPDLEGILNALNHDPAHFMKMTAGLLPILSQLTSGSLAELLSPSFTRDGSPSRERTSFHSVINQRGVIYIGLASLSDPITGSALGSICLADLASVAGDRYDHGKTTFGIGLIIDETAEVMNKQLVQILNKGRGAGVSCYLALQTLSDVVERLGSEAAARMVFGNINNIFMLTSRDGDTQEKLLESVHETTAISIQRAQSSGISQKDGGHSGSVGEKLEETAISLFPQQLLMELPALEYFAILYGGRKIKGHIPILVGN